MAFFRFGIKLACLREPERIYLFLHLVIQDIVRLAGRTLSSA
jgi:hypothetical protein